MTDFDQEDFKRLSVAWEQMGVCAENLNIVLAYKCSHFLCVLILVGIRWRGVTFGLLFVLVC